MNQNVAQVGSGGGVYTRYGSVSLTAGSNVNGNIANGSGAGIYTEYGSTSLNNSSVSQNSISAASLLTGGTAIPTAPRC